MNKAIDGSGALAWSVCQAEQRDGGISWPGSPSRICRSTSDGHQTVCREHARQHDVKEGFTPQRDHAILAFGKMDDGNGPVHLRL